MVTCNIRINVGYSVRYGHIRRLAEWRSVTYYCTGQSSEFVNGITLTAVQLHSSKLTTSSITWGCNVPRGDVERGWERSSVDWVRSTGSWLQYYCIASPVKKLKNRTGWWLWLTAVGEPRESNGACAVDIDAFIEYAISTSSPNPGDTLIRPESLQFSVKDTIIIQEDY